MSDPLQQPVPGVPAPLWQAYSDPASVAARVRAGGTPVIGLLGRLVPRELVVAAGMHPLRLFGSRPRRHGDGVPAPLPVGLAGDLDSDAAGVLGAVLGGALNWLDGLVIGRDRESSASLFAVLRELGRLGEAPGLPPVAFFDTVLLANRTSQRYNRRRARQLVSTLGQWAGRNVSDDDLAGAVEDSRATSDWLQRIDDGRVATTPTVTAGAALVAAGAAQIMPGPELRQTAVAGGVDFPIPSTRVMLTGAGIEDQRTHQLLFQAGLHVVAEDHSWADDGRHPVQITADPLDGIVDKLHLLPVGAARRGVAERAEQLAARLGEVEAAGVLVVVRPGDDSAAWEVPELRRRLPVPVVLAPLVSGHGAAGTHQDGAAGTLQDADWAAASVGARTPHPGRGVEQDRPVVEKLLRQVAIQLGAGVDRG